MANSAQAVWDRLEQTNCTFTGISISPHQAKLPGHTTTFFFGVYTSIFELIDTPTAGEFVHCVAYQGPYKGMVQARTRQEILAITGSSLVGIVSARSPKDFIEAPGVLRALLYPSWRPFGLLARENIRPIVIDVIDPNPDDIAGALALASVFRAKGNPLLALVGVPEWNEVDKKRAERDGNFLEMDLFVSAMHELCSAVSTYRYPRGPAITADAQLAPHDSELTKILR